MAELFSYKCKKCGWSIFAPPKGKDVLMSGELAFFLCQDCKNVFSSTSEFGQEMDKKCPECGSANTVDWKPKDKCPKCGEALKKQEEVILAD